MQPIWEQEVDSDEAEGRGIEDWPACHVTSTRKRREGRTRTLRRATRDAGGTGVQGGARKRGETASSVLSGATGQRRAKPSNTTSLTNVEHRSGEA